MLKRNSVAVHLNRSHCKCGACQKSEPTSRAVWVILEWIKLNRSNGLFSSVLTQSLLQSAPFIADTVGTLSSCPHLLASIRNSGSLFHSNICNSFLLGIIGVSVIAGCPQGESWLYYPAYFILQWAVRSDWTFPTVQNSLHENFL